MYIFICGQKFSIPQLAEYRDSKILEYIDNNILVINFKQKYVLHKHSIWYEKWPQTCAL